MWGEVVVVGWWWIVVQCDDVVYVDFLVLVGDFGDFVFVGVDVGQVCGGDEVGFVYQLCDGGMCLFVGGVVGVISD